MTFTSVEYHYTIIVEGGILCSSNRPRNPQLSTLEIRGGPGNIFVCVSVLWDVWVLVMCDCCVNWLYTRRMNLEESSNVDHNLFTQGDVKSLDMTFMFTFYRRFFSIVFLGLCSVVTERGTDDFTREFTSKNLSSIFLQNFWTLI